MPKRLLPRRPDRPITWGYAVACAAGMVIVIVLVTVLRSVLF